MLQSSHKVSNWIESQRPARYREIPAYSKIMQSERFGDHALRSLRDQKTAEYQQQIREHPPVKTWPEIRPFEIVTAKYVAPDGSYRLREKQVFVDPKTVNKTQEHGSKSAGSSPRRAPLGAGPVVPREVVDECQKTLGRGMTPQRRQQTVGAQIWNQFKGKEDPPEYRSVRVQRGPEEQMLTRNINDKPNAARVGDRSGTSSNASPRSSVASPGGKLRTPRTADGAQGRAKGAVFNKLLASAGLEVGNPLLADQRVSIEYQL